MQLSDFESVVDRYQGRVYGFAYHMLGRREDAQDVTQDVLIRLWRRGDEVDPDRVLPWLLQVTRNACIDRLRRRSRMHEIVAEDADVDGVDSGDASPAESLEQDDRCATLQAALERIAEPYRSIVILREIQEMRYEEISGAMDMPLNTVKVYLHRGRKMLRKQLTEVGEREQV